MSKNVVVTGSNRGIGLAFVQHYLARGHRVFALCRKASPELSATGAEIIEEIDLAASDVADKVLSTLQKTPVDILINNAGILRDERLGEINYGTLLEQFQINAVAPLRLTEALLPNLRQGSKIALITSRMGSIADNTSGGRFGYRMSKAALNMAGMSLARDLKARGIAVAILHPGYVRTAMVGFGGDITPEVAAQRLMSRIDELSLINTGTFWHSNGEILPW